jgi:uncharacterized membrane protein YhhN
MVYFILVIAVILAGVYILTEIKSEPLKAFAVKGLASFGFISLFIVSVYENNAYQTNSIIVCFFALGMVAGLMGDLYLALRPLRPKSENHQIILYGTICFAIGHLFYYLALLNYGTFSIWGIIISLIITIATFMISKLMKLNWGASKYPSIVYSFMLFLVAGQSFINAVHVNFISFSLIVFLGALLFGISDLVLAQIYFKDCKRKGFIVLNLSLYYAAQILLAFSLFLL